MPEPRRRTAKPKVVHGNFAVRFAGDKFRSTCDCGLDDLTSWPEVGKLRVQHDK